MFRKINTSIIILYYYVLNLKPLREVKKKKLCGRYFICEF